jgi:threonine synthase
MSDFSALSHLECPRCGGTFEADRLQGLCPVCSSPLLARYDLKSVPTRREEIGDRRPDLWRYHELLPVSRPENVISLGEGMTPLLRADRLGQSLGLTNVLIKDDGLLPTGSFKARGAAVGVSKAVELGAGRLAMPTNGNAGAAWSAYAARAGARMLVALPESAPAVTRVETDVTGADLWLVDGLISDAGRLVAAAVGEADAEEPWFDVATLKEPYRIEGKKTMGFEIAEQLGWRMPDVIIYPTGGGVGLIGIRKALGELLALGWLEGSLPRLVAVQSSGCAPVVAALEAGATECTPWPDARTVAFGLTVPRPLGDFLILEALAETAGTAIAVEDDDVLDDVRLVAALEGLFMCPEGAATVTAARALRRTGWLDRDDEVVLLNTGAGVLYADALPSDPPRVAASGSIRLRR